MAPKKRQSSYPLEQSFEKEFFSYSFFKAVDLLEKLYSDREPLGNSQDPRKEAVRFSVKPGLHFAASDIAGFKAATADDPCKMNVSFMGLIGPSGVLPHWCNELVTKRNREKDFSISEFYDVFHHRFISLFYLAWKKHQFPVSYQPGSSDKLSGYLLSLAGLGTKGLRGRIGLPEESLSFYSGLLSRQTPSAVSIESAVAYYSGTSVAVEQFVERVIPLSPEDQTCLGAANASLGEDTVCGSFVWDCQTKFRLSLGPMGFNEFKRYMPSGDLLKPIFSFVRYMVGIEYEFEVRVLLKREEVPPCILGADTPAPRLGWTTWVKDKAHKHMHDPYITFEEEGIEMAN